MAVSVLFLNNLGIFDNVYRDIMIDKTKDIQINDIDRAFNLDDVLLPILLLLAFLMMATQQSS